MTALRDGADVTTRSPVLWVAVLATAAAMFGTMGPLSRTLFAAGLAPLGFTVWRAFLGTAATAGLLALRRRRRRGSTLQPGRPGGRVGRGAVMAIGVAAFGALLVNIGQFGAFARIPVALVLLTFYTYPAIVAVVGVALGHERLDRPRAVALALASSGMVAVVATQPLGGSVGLDLAGIGLAFLAAMGQVVFVTASRNGYPAISSEAAMAVILGLVTVGAAVTTIVAGSADSLAFPLSRPDVLGLLLVVGAFTAAIPSILFLNGVRALGGVRAGIVMLVEPLVGVILAAIYLAEPLQPVQILGGLAILTAAVILARAPIEAVVLSEVPVPPLASTVTIGGPGAS